MDTVSILRVQRRPSMRAHRTSRTSSTPSYSQLLLTDAIQYPFRHAFYCNMFRPALYAEVIDHFPLGDDMPTIANPFGGKDRGYAHLSDIVNGKVPMSAGGEQAWDRLSRVLHSREFTAAVFARFGLEDHLQSYDGPKTRILAHPPGFKLNIHPDAVRRCRLTSG